MVNGKAFGFFNSSRGLKQGDPLSSALFIIVAKSYIYLHDNVPYAICQNVKRLTSIAQGTFPFTYLGYPVFFGRRKMIYFEDLLKKVAKRVMGWQNKLLTFGGRYILIMHVLQSMLIYFLSAMNPPKGIIEQLHKIFSKFF